MITASKSLNGFDVVTQHGTCWADSEAELCVAIGVSSSLTMEPKVFYLKKNELCTVARTIPRGTVG
jgi:hypothetical protein